MELVNGLELLTCIGDDKEMALNDMRGDSVYKLSENSPVVLKTKEALKKLKVL